MFEEHYLFKHLYICLGWTEPSPTGGEDEEAPGARDEEAAVRSHQGAGLSEA